MYILLFSTWLANTPERSCCFSSPRSITQSGGAVPVKGRLWDRKNGIFLVETAASFWVFMFYLPGSSFPWVFGIHHYFLAFKFDPFISAWIDDYCENRRNWIHFSGVNIIQWANYKSVWWESNPRIKKSHQSSSRRKTVCVVNGHSDEYVIPGTPKCWSAACCQKQMLWKKAGIHKRDFNKLLKGAASPLPLDPVGLCSGISRGVARSRVVGCRVQGGPSPRQARSSARLTCSGSRKDSPH